MSGQQIGTAVGFVAGFFLPGGPQVWAAVGGFIGGVVDPTEIEGPRIGDGPQQSANEGQPISWILGTAGWVQGNIVQISVRREVRKEDDGKGGPTTVTYEAHQDYCIMAAESSETRESTIVGVLIVRLNGNIVYDMRSESNMGPENAKFLENHTFYYGAEDQLPDPTMEAITGVGNTPAYRGVFTMVARDVNLNEYGGAIPTYEFVLVGEGQSIEDTSTQFIQPRLSRFVDEDWPLADAIDDYLYEGIIGLASVGGSFATYSAESPGEIIDYFTNVFDYSSVGGGSRSPSNYLGYSASTSSTTTPGLGLVIDDFGVSNAASQPSVVDNETLVLVYNDLFPDGVHGTIGFSGSCGIGTAIEQDYRGSVGKIQPNPGGQWGLAQNCGSESIYRLFPLCIRVTRRPVVEPLVHGDPCILGKPTLLPESDEFVIDCEGNVTPAPTYSEESGEFRILDPGAIVFDVGLGRWMYQRYPQGPVLRDDDPDYNSQSFWESAYASSTGLPDDWVFDEDYPSVIDSAVAETIVSTSLETNEIGVATAIQRISKRGGLLLSDIDTDDIVATLLGYPIQADYNAADCIKPLLAYCSSFGSEYDDQIHFHPYGEAIEIVIDPEDFIEGSEETDTGSRELAKEFPRKVSVSYIDIEQNYTVRPQSAWRTTPDVRAIGEETIQVPVCDVGDHAAKLAEIAIKVSYARLQGTRKFSLPYVAADTYLQLVSGMPFSLDGKRWVANRVIIDDGQIEIDAAYDRQSAYTSIATGVPAPDPTPPVSTIGGVTLFVVMNLPALRDQDDRLVLYFAVSGLLTSWPGCLLQWSVDDGVSWQTAISSMTEQSVMGYLTAPLPDADAEGDDTTNTLSVSVHGGELNSISYTQYLNEQNPCAIVYADGTAEVMQFQTATEITEGNYDLTMLGRGRLGSVTGEHSSGARFTMLDSVYSMEIPSALIGREILFRPVTFNTAPENNATYAITFDPAVSQTELAPEFLTASIASDTLSLSVVPRHRFGTDITPIASVNFTGFRWSITDGSNTATQDTDALTPSTTFDVTGWASPIDVSVSQLNRITGAGPALEESI